MSETTTASNLSKVILRNIARARYECTPRPDDRPALAGRYVLPGSLTGVAVWREKGLIDEVSVNGRRYYVLSEQAVQIRIGIAAN